MMFKISRLLAPGLLALGTAAQAEGLSGSIALASDRVERGVSQSSGQASLAGDLEWSHRRGAFVGLGAASVDSDQYGGANVQWSPRAGWRVPFGPAEHGGQWSLGVTAHVFPGASGARLATLPPRAAAALGSTEAQTSDFTTAELNLGLAYRGFTLSLDRALTDYYGIGEDSVQTGPLGQRIAATLADSAGSWHVGLMYRHAFGDAVAVWVGAGRQVIKNFEGLNYTDWTVGASLRALELTWSLEATGTNANSDYWRVQRSSGGTRELASQRVSASVAWAF